MVGAASQPKTFSGNSYGGFSLAMRLSPHSIELALHGRLSDVKFQALSLERKWERCKSNSSFSERLSFSDGIERKSGGSTSLKTLCKLIYKLIAVPS